ncbi:hypothetical protein BHE74_00029546 [Ensete ventricosum]|nr:hypothetical protein BHE74_00029546 [Ensete ventricosum]
MSELQAGQLKGQSDHQRPFLIVVEDIEIYALVTLILNKLCARIKVVTVKAPGFGENRKPSLQDLATLTGGSMRIFSYSILLCSDGL